MAERCRTCASNGVDISAEVGFVFCKRCRAQLPPGICPHCGFPNGELDDRCRSCGADVSPPDLSNTSLTTGPRKLRQTNSHPESPTKKDAKYDANDGDQPNTTPTTIAEDTDMKAMMHRMMHMIGNLSADMQSVKSGVTEAKETAKAAVTIAKDTEKQVSEIQKHQLSKQDVQTMIDKSIEHKLLHQQTITHHDLPTVLFGGMQDLTFDDAKEYVDTTLKKLQLPTPTLVYHKGDDFAGTICTQFETTRAANEVVSKASQSSLKANVWCKKHYPLDTRCALSVLLGLRRQLIIWGFSRRAIRVKDDSLSMTIEGKPILTATTCSDQVTLDWQDHTWKEWKELQDSAELKLLLDRANEKLKTAASIRAKGEGKGKPTGTGQ